MTRDVTLSVVVARGHGVILFSGPTSSSSYDSESATEKQQINIQSESDTLPFDLWETRRTNGN